MIVSPLLSAILAQWPDALGVRNDALYAQGLPLRVVPNPTAWGDGDIIDALGLEHLDEANSLLDILKSGAPDSPYRHFKDVILRGNLDMSKASVRGALSQFVPNPLTQELVDILLAAGVRSVPWTADEISAELNEATK